MLPSSLNFFNRRLNMYYFICQDTLYHSDFFSSTEEMINQLKIDYKLYILFEYIPKQISFTDFKTDYGFYKVTHGSKEHEDNEEVSI